MKQYVKPEFHYVQHNGRLSGSEIAKLTDAELEAYLQESRFDEEKKTYRIRPGFVLREIAGEYAIVQTGGGGPLENTVMIPNESAVFFFNAFQQPSTKADAVMKGLQAYEATEETLRRSADRFVESTLRYSILEEAE